MLGDIIEVNDRSFFEYYLLVGRGMVRERKLDLTLDGWEDGNIINRHRDTGGADLRCLILHTLRVTCIGGRLAGGESRSECLRRESRGLEKSHLLWGTGSPDTGCLRWCHM